MFACQDSGKQQDCISDSFDPSISYILPDFRLYHSTFYTP